MDAADSADYSIIDARRVHLISGGNRILAALICVGSSAGLCFAAITSAKDPPVLNGSGM